MDFIAKLTITALLMITTGAVCASVAGTEIANIQSWLNEGSQGYYKPGSGDQWVRNQADGQRYIKVESNVNYTANNGRTYPVVIEKTGQIDGTKIGKAVVGFAKFLPPIAVGLQIYDLVCELSNICKSDDNTWVKEQPGQYEGQSATCEDAAGYTSGDFYGCNGIRDHPANVGKHLYFFRSPAPSLVTSNCALAGTTGWAYAVAAYRDCTNAPPPEQQPIADSDWNDAEELLNDPRFDEPLLVNGRPVPLANLPIFGNQDPIPLSDIESVNRDSNGNITGTTRTVTELQLSDGATSSRPGGVTGIEVQTKTDYNTEGQPTGTQTSTTTPPPGTTPPEPITISFDGVEGVQIETEQVELEMPEDETWGGEGVCPADVPLPFYDLVIPMEPACDAAAMLRPVVILLATLSALFIVTGLREARTA